jgi:Raf kinase inhibitor-like YbhB/YbcL family protein
MKTRTVAATIFVLVLSVGGAIFFLPHRFSKNIPSQDTKSANKTNPMKISSPEFENNSNIPAKFTCDGEGASPALLLGDIPAGAKSLAFILHDPDAPVAGGFTHWMVFNIDPKTTEIPENGVPADAVQGQNSGGQPRYTGPCPPSGTHHYHFKLFALDSELALDSSAKREDVERAMEGHILEQTELIGLYKRP